MVAGSTGKGCQLRSRSAFSPWNWPQSTSTRRSPTVRRYFDPVTVSVAPRKERDVADGSALMPPLCRAGGPGGRSGP